jgi:hypothetical protein
VQFKYFSYPPILSTLEVIACETPKNSGSAFEKVGECPYRYKPSSAYYARIKRNGKEIRQRRSADKQREGPGLQQLAGNGPPRFAEGYYNDH